MAQGYAYPVGVSGSQGAAKSVSVNLATTDHTTVFTATQKTLVNSVLLTNTSRGILPVYLYILPAGGSSDIQITYKRVWKQEYAQLSLVSGDERTQPDIQSTGNTLTDIILNVGDTLKASCPVAGAINVTAYMSQGVN